MANRGEIALRILRTCREMGIATVAIYSQADVHSPHVAYAEEAVSVGPPPAAESYLNTDAILAAARRTGAEAIHPGYGFLAENAAFVQRCQEEGLVFVGPSPRTLELAGDKISARRAMAQAGLDLSPGSPGALASPEEALAQAEAIGFPVMLKASGGGGGIGLVVAYAPAEIPRAFRQAQSAAAAAFGRGEVFVEKYHSRPRHIEFQVMGDAHGHVLHLGERECSIQRRYQKLIEEAPSPALDDATRGAMGERVARAARTIHYTSAGTFEFLYDGGHFFFNEINARLQVEHPVTEARTGLDLVELQLRVAAGEELGLDQEDVRARGWALECRINAEDPLRDFAPSPGKVSEYRPPLGPGVRVDGTLAPGYEVSPFYDPLIAKVITSGATRTQTIARMRRALSELVISGVATNVAFHREVLGDEGFVRGDLSTAFVAERHILQRLSAAGAPPLEAVALMGAALGGHGGFLLHRATRGEVMPQDPNPWAIAGRGALHGSRREQRHGPRPRG